MIREQKRQQRHTKALQLQQRKEAQSEEETENEEAPRADATSLPNLFPYNEKNPTHYKRPIEPSRTTAHDISSTKQQLSSKNARLSQTQTFSHRITKAPNAFTRNHPSVLQTTDTRCFIQ
jgi:hypothetical protein